MGVADICSKLAPTANLSDLHCQIVASLFVWRSLDTNQLHDHLVACHYGLAGLSCTDLRIASYELELIGLIGTDTIHFATVHWVLSPATRQLFVEHYGEPTWLQAVIH